MIHLIVFIALIGLIVWGISLIPMPAMFKNVIYVIAVICVILFVLQAFGLIGDGGRDMPVPQLR